jgi:hypothetical protein
MGSKGFLFGTSDRFNKTGDRLMRATKLQSGEVTPSSEDEFYGTLFVERPEVDPEAVIRALGRFTQWRGDMGWPLPVPDRTEINDFLEALSASLGESYAASELAYIQLGAPFLWGDQIAGMIGKVLRQNRCTPKKAGKSREEWARSATVSLPQEWRGKLVAKLSSEPGKGSEKWSATHVQSVAYALARWHRSSVLFGREIRPSGSTFHIYAKELRADGISDRSISDYLSRIVSGFRVVADPDFHSLGCEHVIARHRGLGKSAGRTTKTGDKIVGASTIFDLGHDLMSAARELGPRGLHVARDYRNGLILTFAATLPQRARALSYLAFGTSVVLLEKPHVHIVLPGSALKMRETKKQFGGFDKVLTNPVLWTALDDYQRDFRPLFDDGASLFPSIKNMGEAITSSQLGRLCGDLTQKHLGVRVSIHHVRDNVATEASEQLQSGGYLAPALLGHKNSATTMDSYDHAQGMRAAREYGGHIASMRSTPTTLRV